MAAVTNRAMAGQLQRLLAASGQLGWTEETAEGDDFPNDLGKPAESCDRIKVEFENLCKEYRILVQSGAP